MIKHTVTRCATLAIALCLAVSPIAIAHPGRTDKNGGHIDKSTGEYHYHNRGSSSSSSSSSKSSSNSSSKKSSSSKSSSSSSSKTAKSYKAPKDINIYKEADKESQVLGKLSEGDVVTPIESTKYFHKIKHDGISGYVRKADF